MANAPNYHVLFYGSTDGYQGNRAQIAFYDASNVRRCCVDLDWRECDRSRIAAGISDQRLGLGAEPAALAEQLLRVDIVRAPMR